MYRRAFTTYVFTLFVNTHVSSKCKGKVYVRGLHYSSVLAYTLCTTKIPYIHFTVYITEMHTKESQFSGGL